MMIGVTMTWMKTVSRTFIYIVLHLISVISEASIQSEKVDTVPQPAKKKAAKKGKLIIFSDISDKYLL